MKRIVVTSLGLLLALALAVPNCWALNLLFNGSVDNAFLTSGNWSNSTPPPIPPVVVPSAAVPGASDQAIINNGHVVTYGTAAATTLTSLIVGADWPVTGDVGTAGTLNMSAGSIHVTGGGSAFTIARACCSGDGIVNLTGNAALTIDGSDPQVGQRDHGELHIGPSASVSSPTSYWRLGNYGASIDSGLQGDGLLDVQGTFTANVIFLGDSDSHGELRVSGNGSVVLNANLQPNVSTNFPNRSALVQMIGSTASLHAVGDESANGPLEVHNQYKFVADAGGVSPITLSNAVNIDNNDFTVDLTAFPLAPLGTIKLFDAAPGQIYGLVSKLTVLGGVANPASNYHLVYDNPNGDILLARNVPEPSTMVLFAIGAIIAFGAKRHASR
jgi:PEP-CTERM motif